MDLHELGAHELRALYEKKETSPVEVAGALLARIERHDPALGCFLAVLEQHALASARASEARWLRGEARGPLDGVPVAIKDNLCVWGQRATAGSRILERHVA